MSSPSGPARGGETVAVWGTERGEPPFAVRFDDGPIRLVVPDASVVIEYRSLAELES